MFSKNDSLIAFSAWSSKQAYVVLSLASYLLSLALFESQTPVVGSLRRVHMYLAFFFPNGCEVHVADSLRLMSVCTFHTPAFSHCISRICVLCVFVSSMGVAVRLCSPYAEFFGALLSSIGLRACAPPPAASVNITHMNGQLRHFGVPEAAAVGAPWCCDGPSLNGPPQVSTVEEVA